MGVEEKIRREKANEEAEITERSLRLLPLTKVKEHGSLRVWAEPTKNVRRKAYSARKRESEHNKASYACAPCAARRTMRENEREDKRHSTP